MKQYRAVFFDADDTLLDYPAAERFALLAALEEAGVSGDDALVAAYRRHNHDVWSAFERGEITQMDLRSERFRRLAEEYAFSVSIVPGMSERYLDHLSTRADLLPGAHELVETLAAHYPLALITNGIARVQRGRLARVPFAHRFSPVVISEEVGCAKPDPRIFFPALEQHGLAAPEVLYVGDSTTSDMPAARNAGMDFCWFNPAGSAVPDGYAPACIASTLDEIRDFLLPAS